ncbi:MAG: N-6 DNA methylase, partial [Anaerolineae bacterium]|nr:N-6 DNA methylase [Anaerolineae bacterium]
LGTVDKEYYWKHFSTFVKKADLYTCFVEKSLSLLKTGGQFGFIISNGFLRLDSFEKLRVLLLEQTSIERIVDFTDYVFERANVKTAILLFTKAFSQNHAILVATTTANADLETLEFVEIPQDTYKETYKCIFDLSISQEQQVIKRKVWQNAVELGAIFELSFGLKTGDDSKFLTNSEETSKHKPLLRGANIHRYSYAFEGEYVWYAPEQMRAHRMTARPGTSERFEQPKILVRDTGGGLQATFDEKNYYVKDVIVVSLSSKDRKRLLFLTGLINSTLMRFYYETSFPTLHVQRDELASLPIRTIDFDDPADVARHDRVVALVERMLDLHRRLAAAHLAHEKRLLQQQIDVTDKAIDALYALTPEEIAIVEGDASQS